MQMQQVIVYRNPMEAAIWDSLMNGGMIVVLAVFVAAVAGFAAAVYSDKLSASLHKRYGYRKNAIAHFFDRQASKIGIAVFLASLLAMHWYHLHG